MAGVYLLHSTTVLTIGIFLFLLPVILGKRFEIYHPNTEPKKVCGIVDADFNITLTVLEFDTELGAISVNSDSLGNDHEGVCGKFILLSWPNSVKFDFTRSIQNVEISVRFIPKNVFGDLAPATASTNFYSPCKAQLKNDQSSFKCSNEYARYYMNTNTTEGRIRYKVLVNMNDIQIQLKHVNNDTFSPPGPECHVVPVAPPRGQSFWERNWKVVAVTVAVMSCVTVALLVAFHRYHVRRSDKARKIQSIITHNSYSSTGSALYP